MESISLFPVHDNHHQISTFVKVLYQVLDFFFLFWSLITHKKWFETELRIMWMWSKYEVVRGASKGDFKRCTKGRTRQWFVGSADKLEVASATAASLALSPDLSREELAASNIHLLKPTQRNPGAILHRGAAITFAAGRYSPTCTHSRVVPLFRPRPS